MKVGSEMKAECRIWVLAGVLIFCLCVSSVSAADWPMYRNDASNSGTSSETINLPLTEQWHSSAPSVEENGAVVSDGIIYMSTDNYELYAFTVATGDVVTGFPVTIGSSYGTPAVDSVNQKIYSLSESGLQAFNFNGTSAWTKAVGIIGYNYNQGPVIDAGFVYVKAGYYLYKYNSGGGLQWSSPTSGMNTQPSIMGDYVYVNSESGQIRKYNKATGTEVTTGGFPRSTSGSQAALTTVNGKIFHMGNILYAYNANDGSLLWSVPAGGDHTYYDSPAVSGGVVYVYGWDGKMYAFNENTGATMPGFPSVSLNTANDRNWGSPAIAGAKIFIGAGTSQNLTVLGAAGSANAGQVLAKYKTFSTDPQGFDLCSPVISDGVVFIMLDGGGLYAFFASGTEWEGGAIIINDGEECTESQVVTLSLDRGSNNLVTGMRISEDPLFTGASWEPYNETKSWPLSAGFGIKTVYVQFKDSNGQLSNVFNDQIEYSESCAPILPAPILLTPGESVSPGPILNTLTPDFIWSPVTGADNYHIFINDTATGELQTFEVASIPFTLPSGKLMDGRSYRWNMNSYNPLSTEDIGYGPGWGAPNTTRYYFRAPAIPPIVTNFTANVTYGAAPLNVLFNDTSTGSPTTWNWSFGDGETSGEINPLHTYINGGTYTVNLTVTEINGNQATRSKPYYIHVGENELAMDFIGDPRCGHSPLPVQFSDLSTLPHDQWKWDFGDEGTSYVEDPLHIYSGENSYNVSLYIANSSGGPWRFISITGYIRVIPVGVASFTDKPASDAGPLTVQFNDTSTGFISPVNYEWNFGDGETSTDQNPSHIYPTSATSYTYPVTLTVLGYCVQTNTTTRYITVESPPMSALFNADVTEGMAPLKVNFKDTSMGDPITWLWDFGDGTTSPEQNPAHTYAASGLYTVTLEVTNLFGGTSKNEVQNYIGAFASSHDLVFNTPGLSGTTDITFDTSVFIAAGGFYSLTGNILTLDYPAGSPFKQLVITLDPLTSSGTIISGHVISATLETKDLTGSLVAGAEKHTMIFYLNAIPPPGSVVQTDTIEHADPLTLQIFEALAVQNGMTLLDTCYEIFISTTIPESTIISKGIKMIVPEGWYDTYSGSTIAIIGVNSEGDASILSTGSPTQDGNYVIFNAPSFSGYDTFGIAALGSPPPPPSGDASSGDDTAPSGIGVEQPGVQNVAPAPAPAAPPQPATEQLAPPQEGEVASLTMDLSLDGVSVTTTSQNGEITLTIDREQAEKTGATVTTTDKTVSIVQTNFIVLVAAGKITENSGIITGQNIQSITFTSMPMQATIPNVGEVSSSVKAGLASLPPGAMITTSLSEPVSQEVLDAFKDALAKEGRELLAVAYTLTIVKTNMGNTLPATITMTCPPEWINKNGGTDLVSIVRIADDGTTRVLETSLVGYDDTGNMVFEAVSPDGLSIFGLLTAKLVEMKIMADPDAEPVPLSKPAMSTNIGMAGWGLTTIQDNPIILVGAVGVIAVFAYFGLWKRRM